MATRPSREQAQALRLGILHDNQIKEERLIEADGPVTLGSNPECTLHMPDLKRPSPLLLFEGLHGQFRLRAPAGVEGKLSRGGRVEALRGESPSSDAFKEPGKTLRMGDRGKVTIDGVAILFQVVPRALAPGVGATLPFFKRFDKVMASVLGLSLICHLSFVCYVQAMEPPPEPTFEVLRDRIVPMVTLRRPPPDAPPIEATEPIAPDPKVAIKPPRLNKAPSTPKPLRKDRAAIRDQVEKLFGRIGTKGKHGKDAIPESLDDILRPSSGTLKDLLKENVPLIAGKGPRLLDREGDEPKLHGGDAGPEIVVTQVDVVKRRVVPPKLDDGALKAPEAINAPAQLARALQAYSAGISACHTRALNKNPTVGGRIVVGVFVSEEGMVEGVHILEDNTHDETLAKCMSLRIKRWSLPKASAPYELSLPYIFTSPT